jgi:hypothetical protein
MPSPYRVSAPASQEAVVIFAEPVGNRGLPSLRGEGRIVVEKGVLVLRGHVYHLTAWWLWVGAPLLLLGSAGLHIAMPKVGIWIGLSLVVGLVVADFVQRRRGRSYSLRVPKCGARIVQGADVVHVRLELDRHVVGGGSRPPVVEFKLEAREADRLALVELLQGS